MNENCNCKSSSPSPGDTEYMMVKATSQSANACGDPQDPTSSTADCPKQEPEYDATLSSFLVPAFNNTTNIRVCNAAVYSIGQWLQFINPHVVMRITNINGNDISLINACPNNVQIAENPDAGSTVNTGTRFYPSAKPPCRTQQEIDDEVLSALQNAERIRMDELVESTSTAYLQPTGVVLSDSGDSGWTASLQRIFGFVFKAGTPVFTALQAPVAESLQTNHRRLGIHKTTKEVVPLANYSESPGISASGQHALSIKQGSEKVVGPVSFLSIFANAVVLKSDTTDLTLSPNYNEAFILNDPQKNAVVRNQDNYHAMVKLTFLVTGSVSGAENKLINVFLNGQKVGIYFAQVDSGFTLCCTMPVKVDGTTNQIVFNCANNVTLNGVRLGVEVLGIWI